jgi:GT2 family glycosyltransferase
MTDKAEPSLESSADHAGDLPDVSILIVAYNSADLIEDCIDSITPACRQHRFEILLIDNGDQATAHVVQARYPQVRIVESRGNIGFAGGNNALAEHARAPLLLLLNPDMELEPCAIDALLDGAARHSDAAAWGGVTLNPEGAPDSGNAIAMPSMTEFLSVVAGRSRIGSMPLKGVHEDARVDVVSGGFVMFSRSAWEAAGGLDERYFLYGEEVDLFYRLSKQGHAIWRIADARGFHKVGHGAGMSPMRLLYRAAGNMQFLHLHWSRIGAWTGGMLMWIAALERFLAGRLLGGVRPRMKAMGEGYRLVALKPHLWFSGYHPETGLMAQLARNPFPEPRAQQSAEPSRSSAL